MKVPLYNVHVAFTKISHETGASYGFIKYKSKDYIELELFDTLFVSKKSIFDSQWDLTVNNKRYQITGFNLIIEDKDHLFQTDIECPIIFDFGIFIKDIIDEYDIENPEYLIISDLVFNSESNECERYINLDILIKITN